MNSQSLNMNIDGKNGKTEALSIQSHMPDDDMVFIKLSSGMFLFCQKNHPIIVNDGIVKEAGVVSLGDKIWCDTTIACNENRIVPEITPELLLSYVEQTEICSLVRADYEKAETKYIRGTSYKNYRLVPEFIQWHPDWLKKFIINFIDRFGLTIKTQSINLVQQLMFICIRVGFSFDVDVIERCSTVEFILTMNTHSVRNVIKQNCEVEAVKIIKSWNSPVFDIKTKTEEFMIGGVQTHNSFHTGGAVELRIPNIKNELMLNIPDNDRTILDKVCEQVDGDLINKSSFCSVYIDKQIFTEKYKIEEDSDFIKLPLGYFDITFEDYKVRSMTEMPVKFYKNSATIEKGSDYYLLTYTKDKTVFKIEPRTIEAAKMAQKIDEAASGNSPWTDALSLYWKLYYLAADFNSWDSVHLETAISNLLRAKKDPQLPARLKEPYDPVMYSIKSLPGIMSWPLGLSFENFGAGITRGLISDRAPESDVERILFGEPISPFSVKK